MDAGQSQLSEDHLERASSDDIRNDIRGTRRDMDETLDELGDRLHPRHLLDSVIDLFRGDTEGGSESRQRMAATTQRLGRGLAQQIREHPLPALLAGVAIARWIFEASEDKGEARRFGRTAGDSPGTWSPEERPADWSEPSHSTAGAIKERAGEAASKVGQTVSSVASNVGERVSGAAEAGWDRLRGGGRALGHYTSEGGHAIRQQANVVRDRFRQTSDDFPLPVGGVFLAAGVLTGLLLPRTEKEDEWMGAAADQFKDETMAKGEDLLERGKDLAAKTASSAMDEAEARGLTASGLLDKAERVASEALKAGKEAAREEGISPSTLKDKASAVARTASETAKQEGRKQVEQTKAR